MASGIVVFKFASSCIVHCMNQGTSSWYH